MVSPEEYVASGERERENNNKKRRARIPLQPRVLHKNELSSFACPTRNHNQERITVETCIGPFCGDEAYHKGQKVGAHFQNSLRWGQSY